MNVFVELSIAPTMRRNRTLSAAYRRHATFIDAPTKQAQVQRLCGRDW